MTKKELLEAIHAFYNDRSRSRGETRFILDEVADELELLIESLKDEAALIEKLKHKGFVLPEPIVGRPDDD